MKSLRLWLQRFYLLGFLLFAWYIAPFTRFPALFPVEWSLVVLGAALAIPAPSAAPAQELDGPAGAQGVLTGLLVGLTFGSADWSILDFTLFVEFCWALMPLFLCDRFFAWVRRRMPTLA